MWQIYLIYDEQQRIVFCQLFITDFKQPFSIKRPVDAFAKASLPGTGVNVWIGPTSGSFSGVSINRLTNVPQACSILFPRLFCPDSARQFWGRGVVGWLDLTYFICHPWCLKEKHSSYQGLSVFNLSTNHRHGAHPQVGGQQLAVPGQ